jgi:hypothetical protein
MFDNDEVTESRELRALRDALDGVAIPQRPPLAAITARGGRHRRNRHSGVAGLFAAGAAAGAAVTVALVGGGTAGHGTIATPPQDGRRTPRAIRTASYTLVSDTSGTVKLTISPWKLFRPAALQSDLARFGVPAKVTDGRFCTSDPAPAGLSRAVSISTGRRQTITFHPAAIPHGTELSFGRFRLQEGIQVADFGLIDTDHHACSDRLPTDTPTSRGGRMGYVAIPPGQATSRG